MNGKGCTRSRIILTAGAALIILATPWLLPGGLILSVTPRGESDPVAELPLKEGERFTIHYYHSVEDSPIWEDHSVDSAGCIYIEEERYLKFGAGLGRIPGRGRLARRGPYEVIEDIHRPLCDFLLRVGALGVDHTIIWRGKRINLSKTLAGRAVWFKAEPISLAGKLIRQVSGPIVPTETPTDR